MRYYPREILQYILIRPEAYSQIIISRSRILHLGISVDIPCIVQLFEGPVEGLVSQNCALVSDGASRDCLCERYLSLMQKSLDHSRISYALPHSHKPSMTHPRRFEATKIGLLRAVVARSLARYATARAQPGEECCRLKGSNERRGHCEPSQSAQNCCSCEHGSGLQRRV